MSTSNGTSHRPVGSEPPNITDCPESGRPADGPNCATCGARLVAGNNVVRVTITFEALSEKLYALDPHERHECHWVMSKAHARELWDLSRPPRDPDDPERSEDSEEFERLLPQGAVLLGRPVVIDDTAREVQIISDACTCIRHEDVDGIDKLVILPPDGCPKHDKEKP